MNLVAKIIKLSALLWREVLTFGAVGGLGWLIDNGIYTLLWHGPMSESTIKARVVSTIAATLFAWFANRYWTFRHRRSERVWKEFTLFLLMNGLGLGIVLACQVVSRYVLGFTSFTADFIAGGVVGLILGTIFRFLAYRYFVFNKELAGVVGEDSVGENAAGDSHAGDPGVAALGSKPARVAAMAPRHGAAGNAAPAPTSTLANRRESPGNPTLIGAGSPN